MSEVIPEGWKFAPLGEYAKLQGGNAFKSEQFAEIGIPLIRISNIKSDGRVDLSETVHYKESPSLDKFKVFYGDVLLAMSGATTGKIGTYKSKQCSYLNQRVGRFCPNEQKLHSIFLSQIVQGITFSKQVLIDAIGGAQPNISSSQVEKIFFCFPPLPEQKKIASILTSVDEVIENTQKQIDKLQDLKKATMNELLTKGIGHTEFKDSELGRIPKSWEVVELKDYLTFISYGFTNPMPETSDGIPMITARDVREGCIDYENSRNTSREAYDSLLTAKSKPIVGDILLTKDGTLGRVALVDREQICINQSVAVLRPNQTVSGLFLKNLLEAPYYQNTMIENAGGSTIKHIYITVVDKMKVVKPSVNEQEKIVCIISALNKKISSLDKKLSQTQALKKSLMQDLLTGKKRVQVN